ncbi:hypothetical protein Ciccas_008114 [Cichlidogyrus casuarinus]|uniref:Uncharacterized protein n=1 Tax=Cichlidogyrus casuarinus TaxID=1844966 RepID=A0ABD2Q178_9PLAT
MCKFFQAPTETYYHRPLSKYRSTGNFSFEYAAYNRSGNQSPRYEYSPLEHSNDNLAFCKSDRQAFDEMSESPPSPAPDPADSILSSQLHYTDVKEAFDSAQNWQQQRRMTGSTLDGFRSRGIIVQPSLGPVIDASDESTSDGKSGSQNTEKLKIAVSDQSSLNFTHQSSSSSQDCRMKSMVNLQKRRSQQRFRTTPDTSLEDNSFEFDSSECQQRSVQRPNSLVVVSTNLNANPSHEYRENVDTSVAMCQFQSEENRSNLENGSQK